MSLLRIDAFIKFENQIILKHKRRSTKRLKELVDANTMLCWPPLNMIKPFLFEQQSDLRGKRTK